MRHKLKIKMCYLIHILEGKKSFDIRFNDRDYQVGDEIEFDPLADSVYNLEAVLRTFNISWFPIYRIKYVHTGLGMDDGYVALELEKI